MITYRVEGDVVVIEGMHSSPITLNLKSAEMAVENIKARRPSYATEEAYQRHLSCHEQALSILRAELIGMANVGLAHEE